MSPTVIRDVIIVGAGPAGLTAATYLGRFRRPPLVIDAGQSRARWIPISHNIPGFQRGISGTALLSEMRLQAEHYGAEFLSGAVEELQLAQAGVAVKTGAMTLLARFVLLATGVTDHFPRLAHVEEATLRSVLRFCPICDGFEATGRNVAIIGNGPLGIREARFLRDTYSDRVTYLHLGNEDCPGLKALATFGIAVRCIALEDLHIEAESLRVSSHGETAAQYDVLYAALGCTTQHKLVRDLGATLDESGAVKVDSHQQTSLDRIYAAGDVVRGLNQVVVAAAEAAIAATAIHNRLREARLHP